MLHNMAKPSAKRSKKKTCKSRKRKCQHVCFPGPVEEDVIVFDGDLSQTHVPGFETGSLHHTPRGTSGEDVPHISRGSSAQDTPHTPTREQAAPHTHEKGMSGHTNPVPKPDTAFFKYDDVTYNMGNVNLYQADTIFHAVAMSLIGSTKKWSSIEKDGTNLGFFILRRLDDYSAAGKNGERVDHMFVRWLVIEYLKNADETDKLFKRASTHGYEHCTITAADISELRKQALSSQKDKEEVHAYVKIEHQMELVLHLAFGGLITIIRLLKKESTISFADMYDRNCSGPKTDDKSFLFLERNNFMEQSDGSFMLSRSELQDKLASGAFVEARSPSVKTNKPKNQCHEMRNVPQTQGGSSDICGFEYDGTKYRMGKVDVHETESIFHAVALSLIGSADKWSSIEKDETNLCHFLLQKLRTYKALGSSGTLDHMFIRWLVAAFLNDIGQTKKHEIFRTTTGFRGNISRSEIDKYKRYATIPNLDAHEQQDLVQNRHRMEFLLHAAFEGLITIVRPVTEDYDLGKHHMWKRVSSRPGTDDRSFILLSYRKSLQLSDKSFMLTRADLKNPLYVPGGSTAAQGEKEAERSQSQPPQTGLKRQNCADMQIVPTDALLKRDMAVFKYQALTYNVGEVHVHEAESFFHAVALGLLGSADKWASIDKDETNLCYFLLQKLGAYKASRTGGTFDHMFIRWLVANFLDDVRQDNEHDIFRSTAGFGGNISMSEIDDYIRFATNDKPTPAEQQLFVTIKPKMEFLLHTALKGLVTIVRPVTVEYDLAEHQLLERVSSRSQTDDRSFILLNYTKTLQLSDKSFMLTRAELMKSPIYVPKESAAPPGEQEAERQAPPPLTDSERHRCGQIQSVTTNPLLKRDMAVFDYDGVKYNLGAVNVHKSETLFHAVATGLMGSAEKWPNIEKDERNLCSFLLEKMNAYSKDGKLDHLFIRWLITDFLGNVNKDHELFQDNKKNSYQHCIITVDDIPRLQKQVENEQVNPEEKNDFKRVEHQMEMVVQAALGGLVTIVRPVTKASLLRFRGMSDRRCSGSNSDDRSFLFLDSTNPIQQSDGSFMLSRAELNDHVASQGPPTGPAATQAELLQSKAPPPQKTQCEYLQRVPETQAGSLDISAFEYGGIAYNTGKVDVQQSETLFHAVALSLRGSVNKWPGITKDGTNLCSFLLEKLIVYKEEYTGGEFDHMFIRWLIRQFLDSVSRDNGHYIFRDDDDEFESSILYRQIKEYERMAIIQDPTKHQKMEFGGNWHHMEFLLHAALQGLVTVVLPITDDDKLQKPRMWRRVRSRPHTDDKSFIFLNYSDKSVDSIQLSDKSFMMTRAELLQSPHYVPKESAGEDKDVAAAEDWENLCNKYQKPPVDGPKRTEERSYVKYQDRSYNTGMMTSYDVPGDGQCFYHAVAKCLSASADKWWAVERGETNLCSVLNAKLVGYASTKRTKRDAMLDAGFVKWLITDFLHNVDDQHELFREKDEIGLRVLVFDPENGKDGDFPATTKMILDRGKARGRACYGGKEEAYILHYALHRLVTIVMMAPDTNSILGTHAVCSHKMDDQAFIFLKLVVKQTKTYDYEHWNSLKHSESGSFLMSVKDFKEKAMYDKCNEDIIEINSQIDLSTFKVPYPPNSELMVYKTSTRTFHEAVAVCLAQHRIRGEWSNAMCNILREKYHEFILLGGGDNTDFVRFVGNANDSGSKTEDESMDGIDGIEGSQDGFQGNTRVYLHRSTGLVPRKTKPRSSDHADLTYELHVYQDISKEYHPIVLGQQVEDDQIHTPAKVIEVLSGVFHGVMQNRPVPWDVQGYLLGYDLGKCKSEDIVVASKTPPNVKQCGLVDMKLVGFDGRTGVPSLATRPGAITWRTTVRRELDRADLLFIIVATGMKSSPEEATTFYMGNGVIWKVTLKRHALHDTPHYKHNLLDELNKLFDRVDAYSGDRLDMGHGTGVPRMSLDQKLAAVRKFLRYVGLKGSVEVMQYRGIEQMGDGKYLFGVATARATFLKNMEKNKIGAPEGASQAIRDKYILNKGSLEASKEGIRYTSENAITASYADVFTVRKTRTNARTVSVDDFDEVEEQLVEDRLVEERLQD